MKQLGAKREIKTKLQREGRAMHAHEATTPPPWMKIEQKRRRSSSPPMHEDHEPWRRENYMGALQEKKRGRATRRDECSRAVKCAQPHGNGHI
jgi:hypothetical protein